MALATLSGTPCTIYDYKNDEQGRLWCMVKCEYYERPLPVYAGFIEVLKDDNKNAINA